MQEFNFVICCPNYWAPSYHCEAYDRASLLKAVLYPPTNFTFGKTQKIAKFNLNSAWSGLFLVSCVHSILGKGIFHLPPGKAGQNPPVTCQGTFFSLKKFFFSGGFTDGGAFI